MINHIKKIWSEMILLFSPKARNSDSIIKRFKIDNSVNVMVENSKRKKFQITNERNVPKRNEKFNTKVSHPIKSIAFIKYFLKK